MIATLSFDFEGWLHIYEGVHEDTQDLEDPLATVPASAIVGLGLFDETRPGFDYDLDSGRLAEMLIWKLEDAGLEPDNFDELERKVSNLCVPGPSHKHPTTVQLVKAP